MKNSNSAFCFLLYRDVLSISVLSGKKVDQCDERQEDYVYTLP
jgi:hypothetical protein